MLNSSKKFVKYLDNFDKVNQKNYHTLLFHIRNEFNMYYRDSNDFIYQNGDNENALYSPKNTLTRVRSFEKSKNIFDKQIVKEKITIEDEIENFHDLIHITEKYDINDEKEYNIDLQLIQKIKPELIELNSFIGVDKLKQNVLNQLLYFLQDLHITSKGGDYKHTVIYGPPGTGKTEIARILGKMYSKIGVLQNNKFVKVTRQDLIAGYLGQTAIKTAKVIEEARGGVLFIDEAYSLASSEKEDSFSKECLDTLCESLSNYKNDLMVIIAGYEHELNNTFFRVNKGLDSRFIWRFSMDPYNPEELMEIYKKIVRLNEWSLKDDALSLEWFKKNSKCFVNYGRDMEQLFTYTKISHSRRIYGKNKDEKKKISDSDIEKALKMFMDNRKEQEEHKPYLYGLYV
jgi:SpoVK/Ycf46/Vps4 family AAA+-type ATPase